VDVTPRSRGASAGTDLLSTGEAAKELGVSGKTVLRWINDGLLPARRTRAGGQYRVDRADLERFKAEQQEIRPKDESGGSRSAASR
jgi:excisionase family DNA binding protein